MRKYTKEEVKELLEFFRVNNILLISESTVGDVNFGDCLISEGWLTDMLTQGD